MKIALASSPAKNKDVAYNLTAMRLAIRQCSGKADLILFGESALQGFECLAWNYELDRRIAVSQDDPQITQLCHAAEESGIAVSFGYIEKHGETLYSSQLVIDENGEIIHNFHRVSPGWKEPYADAHYAEGAHFSSFPYKGRKFAIGLCGDLWNDGRPEEMKALGAEIILWPVWCDYPADEWNRRIKQEYAAQAALCGENVLLVNPYCADEGRSDADAAGGAVHFHNGAVAAEAPAGRSDILIVTV